MYVLILCRVNISRCTRALFRRLSQPYWYYNTILYCEIHCKCLVVHYVVHLDNFLIGLKNVLWHRIWQRLLFTPFDVNNINMCVYYCEVWNRVTTFFLLLLIKPHIHHWKGLIMVNIACSELKCDLTLSCFEHNHYGSMELAVTGSDNIGLWFTYI